MIRLPGPENSASQLLHQSGQTRPSVDLERIIAIWDEVSLGYDELKHEGYFMDLGGFGKQIVVRSTAPLARQRFTIAHEVGHLLLHEKGIHVNSCASFRNPEYKYNFIERWCDSFAASLLMPRDWLLSDLQGKSFTNFVKTMETLPTVYKVSKMALRKRIAEISNVSTFQIEETDRELTREIVIRKRYVSKRAKGYYLQKTLDDLIPRLEASEDTIIFSNPNTLMRSGYSSTKNEKGYCVWTVFIVPENLSFSSAR